MTSSCKSLIKCTAIIEVYTHR